jgi:RNA polymerase sigma-70 factor (ECF subfamily)
MTVPAELRALYPRVLGKMLAITRRLADAEDAVQDAVERALVGWQDGRTPDSPEAWLLTVATNCHRDRLRRAQREVRHADALTVLAEMSPWVQGAIATPEIAHGWKDDLLRLLFACSSPALEAGESAALALSTVLGLSNQEIAQAFAVAPRSMDQRLTRARWRLREDGEPEAPRPERARERIPAVLAVIHLLFNEGYWSTDGEAPIRGDLCRLAIGLGHSLEETFPAEPEVRGLLALMLLHEARRPARLDVAGAAVPLPEQERSRWDQSMIREGVRVLDAALAAGSPGPFQIEAAISATHCLAVTAAETDWQQISELYRLLEPLRPTPAVRVNRAFAVARAIGAKEGLALLDEQPLEYSYASLVRGALLEELGQSAEAIAALELAAGSARNPEEQRQILRRIARIREKGAT